VYTIHTNSFISLFTRIYIRTMQSMRAVTVQGHVGRTGCARANVMMDRRVVRGVDVCMCEHV